MADQKYEAMVYIQKRNGAYLVSMGLNDLTDDLTPEEMFDAAGSLATAKRVGVQMVVDMDAVPSRRWRRTDWSETTWVLDAYYDGEDG